MQTLLQELIDSYEMSDIDRPAFLDLHTGEVVFDDEKITGTPGIDWDDEKSDERFKPLPKQDSREEYMWMEEFSSQISNDKKQKALFQALNHRKPFRNFKDAIIEQDVREEWFSYRDKMIEMLVSEWLEDHAISTSKIEKLRGQ